MKEEQKANNENIYKKDKIIKNKINLENNLKQFINKLQDINNYEESDNIKNVKEEEKKVIIFQIYHLLKMIKIIQIKIIQLTN